MFSSLREPSFSSDIVTGVTYQMIGCSTRPSTYETSDNVDYLFPNFKEVEKGKCSLAMHPG